MPLPIAPLVGILLGVAIAWAGRAPLAMREGSVMQTRPFHAALALASIVYVPVVAYFAAFHGDWAYLYLVPWSRVPSAIDLALVLLSGACVMLGFSLAVSAATNRRTDRLARVAALPAILFVAVLAIASSRLVVSASYTQFHGDFGVIPIGRSPLGRGVLASWVALSAAVVWAARVARRVA